jgi:hypothetical protein
MENNYNIGRADYSEREYKEAFNRKYGSDWNSIISSATKNYSGADSSYQAC